jgi:hypothetical protein
MEKLLKYERQSRPGRLDVSSAQLFPRQSTSFRKFCRLVAEINEPVNGADNGAKIDWERA